MFNRHSLLTLALLITLPACISDGNPPPIPPTATPSPEPSGTPVTLDFSGLAITDFSPFYPLKLSIYRNGGHTPIEQRVLFPHSTLTTLSIAAPGLVTGDRFRITLAGNEGSGSCINPLEWWLRAGANQPLPGDNKPPERVATAVKLTLLNEDFQAQPVRNLSCAVAYTLEIRVRDHLDQNIVGAQIEAEARNLDGSLLYSNILPSASDGRLKLRSLPAGRPLQLKISHPQLGAKEQTYTPPNGPDLKPEETLTVTLP